jgi:hypothetical protein
MEKHAHAEESTEHDPDGHRRVVPVQPLMTRDLGHADLPIYFHDFNHRENETRESLSRGNENPARTNGRTKDVNKHRDTQDDEINGI